MRCVLVEVAVEVAGDDPVEAVVREREREAVALDELGAAHARRAATASMRALWSSPVTRAAQMTCEEAGAARDVERPSGGERRERRGDRLELLVEPGRSRSA